MKTKLIVLLLGTLVIGFTGCTNVSYCGVVNHGKELSSNSFAPDITFVSADGKEIKFNKTRQPIAILAFTSAQSQNCCQPKPELVELANRFKSLPIAVAQIYLPTDECSYEAGCSECNITSENMVTLFDSERIAWNAYNRPSSNTVILVDKNNKIVHKTSIDNLQVLANKAENMGEQTDEEEFDMMEFISAD